MTNPYNPTRPTSRAGRKVLAQWRGVDLEPLEIAHSLKLRPIEQMMPNVVKSLGLERRRAETEIIRVWNDLIDPTVTAHAQPVGLVRGTLFVNVDSNVWLSEIVRYRSREILERLRHSFGRDLILKISYRLG